MTDRELLKEARNILVAVDRWNHDVETIIGRIPSTGFEGCEKIIARIDTALAEPEPGAMEIAEKIRFIYREFHFKTFDDDQYRDEALSKVYQKVATLIEQYGRRVPREMLREIELEAWRMGRSGNVGFVHLDTIATKYGVKIEEE